MHAKSDVWTGLTCSHSYIVPSFSDNCRTLRFEDTIDGKSLVGHVVRSFYAKDSDMCQIHCFMEKRCASYNYGNETCDLNDSNKNIHPWDFVDVSGSFYRGAEVSIILRRYTSIYIHIQDKSRYSFHCRCMFKKNREFHINNLF